MQNSETPPPAPTPTKERYTKLGLGKGAIKSNLKAGPAS
jgi:hypothetical protein